jgi:pimeloyl-ACP methyl ester carboxylesterase
MAARGGGAAEPSAPGRQNACTWASAPVGCAYMTCVAGQSRHRFPLPSVVLGRQVQLKIMAQPPILLVHGAFSHAHHFDGWVGALARAGFDCHAPSLPDHWPSDASALASLTLSDYLASLHRTAAALSAPPVVIGHSMGGLLAQQLAATAPCTALICVASAPPWILVPQLPALPFLARQMPAILAGRPIRPDEGTLRRLALHDLPEPEQYELVPTFGAESGQAFRTMLLGSARIPGRQFQGPVLCLSGSEDRVISNRISKVIARYYSARHETFAKRGHWLIASSAHDEIVTTIVRWIEQHVINA